MTDDRGQSQPPQLDGSDAPATKADVARLWQIIDARLTEITAQMATGELLAKTQQSVDNLADHFAQFSGDVQAAVTENRDHFDAALENIREELVGANKDEISGLQDGHQNHEQRITTLEERVELR